MFLHGCLLLIWHWAIKPIKKDRISYEKAKSGLIIDHVGHAVMVVELTWNMM